MYHASTTSIAALLKQKFLDWVENLQSNAERKQKLVGMVYQWSICVAIIPKSTLDDQLFKMEDVKF